MTNRLREMMDEYLATLPEPVDIALEEVAPQGPRILIYDIETCPPLVRTWGLWDQNIGLVQVVEPPRILSIGWVWYDPDKRSYDEDEVGYTDEAIDTQEEMLTKMWDLFDEATHLAGWNNGNFDDKWVMEELFIKSPVWEARGKPSEAVCLDFMRASKKHMRHLSNKLQWFLQRKFGVSKVDNGGMALWMTILHSPDPEEVAKAWALMQKYCKGDVRYLPWVFRAMLPFLKGINWAAYTDNPTAVVCPRCGSANLHEDGTAYAGRSVFVAFRCTDCLTRSRPNRSIARTTMVEI